MNGHITGLVTRDRRLSGTTHAREGAARTRTYGSHPRGTVPSKGVNFSTLPDPVEELITAREAGYRDL